MKKFLSLVLVLGLSATLLAGCGGKKEETTPPADSGSQTEAPADEGYTAFNIIAAHGSTETVAQHTSLVYFKELLEERSGGVITVDIYPNQQLGGDREYTEACVQGNVTMGAPSPAAIAALVPSLNAFETPFLFSSYETARATMDSEAGQALLDSMADYGLKGLGYFENGFRNLTCNREVNTLADLKGLKIRTMENEVHLAIWTALGANPSPLAFGELYTALQQKAFDAQENPLEQIYNNKLHEVQDHVYLTQHIYTPYVVFMNLDVWNSLNAKTQELVQQCMDEAVQNNRETCDVNNQKCTDGINDSGLSKVYEVSEDLRKEMIAACTNAGIYDKVIEAAGGTYAQDLWAAAGFEY
ncbi:TRAP transporter substrate-binding protein [uncultured Oscillibacter sp.]|uniref:TRAP transporter substrate-binding protein n=1 Tax=uncultured Oscillibacter sp. TaxID=876091 RepID=UPI0025EE7483|nr:TRAP transporter substrate-binding protein [uncultured Oscillibacter sp.]